MIKAIGVEMEETCGACPHQFQGTVDGNPAFFRLRHSWWRFCISEPGGNPIGPGLTPDKKVLFYREGSHEPGQDSGVMLGAEDFILKMIEEFRAESKKTKEQKLEEALSGLINALEKYYAPADSIHEAYSDSPEVQEAVTKAYRVLGS
jgi:hypothetical protein